MADATRVLLCDDALGFPRLVEGWLQDMPDLELVGMTREQDEVVEEASRLAPDVILLDVVLPHGQIGEALLGRVRAAAPAARVVLISSLPAPALEQEAARLGADGFCSKATTPEGLREAVQAALSGPGAVRPPAG